MSFLKWLIADAVDEMSDAALALSAACGLSRTRCDPCYKLKLTSGQQVKSAIDDILGKHQTIRHIHV